MLFIDQPAQVGFSYSEAVPGFESNLGNIVVLPDNECPRWAAHKCATYSAPNIYETTNSTIGSAQHMWQTLQGFMGAFPQYSRSGFNFATESYGGHYGPVYNEYVFRINYRSLELTEADISRNKMH